MKELYYEIKWQGINNWKVILDFSSDSNAFVFIFLIFNK